MINNVVLVGRIVFDPVIKEASNGKNVCEVTLAVKRPFKNINNTYDTDYIKVTFWEYLAINVNEYCQKGYAIGVIARIQVRKMNVADKLIEVNEVIGEQLIFISRAMPKADSRLDDEIQIIPNEEVIENK